jgi:hypothetical protein
MGFLAALSGLGSLLGAGTAAAAPAAATAATAAKIAAGAAPLAAAAPAAAAAKATALNAAAPVLGAAVLPQAAAPAATGLGGLLGTSGMLGMLSNPLVSMALGAALGPYLSGGRNNDRSENIPEGQSDREQLPSPGMNIPGIVYPEINNGLYRPGIDPEPRYFRGRYYAQGGLVNNSSRPIMTRFGPIYMSNGGIASLIHANVDQRQQEQLAKQQLVLEAARVIRGLSKYDPRIVLGKFLEVFGEAALRDLINRVESGQMDLLLKDEQRMVRGPGDGMSDEVPGSIDGQKEVRLSDGEFVIPADVVSGLGNGSSDAGAQRLKEMMAKVRALRTGTTRQAPEIDPQSVMPV